MPKKGQGKSVLWLREHATYAGDDCLIFPFARSRSRGYGHFGYNGEMHYAHRFMCELVHGPAPSPIHQATHNCGKGHDGCVTPRHLEWKTNSGNQIDRWRGNGRKVINRNGSRTKLTPEQITEMRALKGRETIERVAQRFGVKRGCVEYWQRSSHAPVPQSHTPQAIRQRRKRGGY